MSEIKNYMHMFYLQPALKTFEMDIMDEMGIEENRVPKKFYWY